MNYFLILSILLFAPLLVAGENKYKIVFHNGFLSSNFIDKKLTSSLKEIFIRNFFGGIWIDLVGNVGGIRIEYHAFVKNNEKNLDNLSFVLEDGFCESNNNNSDLIIKKNGIICVRSLNENEKKEIEKSSIDFKKQSSYEFKFINNKGSVKIYSSNFKVINIFRTRETNLNVQTSFVDPLEYSKMQVNKFANENFVIESKSSDNSNEDGPLDLFNEDDGKCKETNLKELIVNCEGSIYLRSINKNDL